MKATLRQPPIGHRLTPASLHTRPTDPRFCPDVVGEVVRLGTSRLRKDFVARINVSSRPLPPDATATHTVADRGCHKLTGRCAVKVREAMNSPMSVRAANTPEAARHLLARQGVSTASVVGDHRRLVGVVNARQVDPIFVRLEAEFGPARASLRFRRRGKATQRSAM